MFKCAVAQAIALAEEQISEKISRRILSGDQGMLVWWSIATGVHVEPHSHANEQVVWMLKGKMEFRLGSEQRTPRSTMPSSIGIGVSNRSAFRHERRFLRVLTCDP
jgi:quercetin dioxygenase-like cupin family protein